MASPHDVFAASIAGRPRLGLHPPPGESRQVPLPPRCYPDSGSGWPHRGDPQLGWWSLSWFSAGPVGRNQGTRWAGHETVGSWGHHTRPGNPHT